MLSVITGKQRSGKTFFCVTQILDYLRHSKDRHIYTNLPLNPDFLCRVAAGRNNVVYHAYLSRIHLFKTFRRRQDCESFLKRNHDYCKLHLIQPEENIKSFWLHVRPNSIIMLDEVYQWFSSRLYRDSESADRRAQLLTYTRQHGHYKDDMILITHKICDVDKAIRDGTQYFYIVRNSKYTNMFSWRWMRGLKWPYQFFIIQGFEDGDEQLSDCWNLFPDKRIFRCYDSFSAAESIPGKSLPGQDSESTDTGLNFWWNFKRFAAQAWIGLAVLGGLGIGGYYAYTAIRSFGAMSSADVAHRAGQGAQSYLSSSAASGSAAPSLRPSDGAASFPVAPPAPRFAKIRSIMPNMIIFEDDYIIRKGGYHEGFKVVSISKELTKLDNDGKIYTVRNTGLHVLPDDYQQQPGKRVSGVSSSGLQPPGSVSRQSFPQSAASVAAASTYRQAAQGAGGYR
ncbi:MAG: zonular occludens toxin domain-containing protein [Methylococcales bacterium]|nr:zonular occludens toxin domain-containing protein [Methylococcales bacterium]